MVFQPGNDYSDSAGSTNSSDSSCSNGSEAFAGNTSSRLALSGWPSQAPRLCAPSAAGNRVGAGNRGGKAADQAVAQVA